MTGLLVRRLVITPPTLLVVSLLAFGMILLVPGDPAVTLAGPNATVAEIEATRRHLGLDEPVLVQYQDWLTAAVRGDFGESLFTGQAVRDALFQRLPATGSLTAGALLVTVAVGIPCGISASLGRGGVRDRVLSVGAALGVSMPSYFLGMLLILFFAIWSRLLPATSYVPFGEDPVEWARHLVLPSVALGLSGAAVVARQLRSSLVGVLDNDYIATAWAKGLRRPAVVGKHALKNAAIPVVTVLGGQVGALLSGAVIVEQVFGIPGLGQLAVEAVLQQDVPVIQGVVLFTALIVTVTYVVVDIAYGYLNPRVRVG